MTKLDHTIWMKSAIGDELTESEAREIHYISHREEYQKGERLFVEDDAAAEIFLIVSGHVDVVKKGRDERKTVLSSLGAGAILGEMSLLMQDKRSSSAIAIEKTLVFRVNWEEFQKLLKNEPKVAFKIVNGLARLLATRLKKINAKVAELMTADGHDEGIEELAAFKQRLMSDWKL